MNPDLNMPLLLQLELQNQIRGPVSNGFQIFKKEAELIQNEYPGLKLDADEMTNAPCLSGIIQLESENGDVIDRYKLKIVAIPEYPTRFPYVFETEGRIPLNIDWHVYPNDGHCCISSFPEEILTCKKGINLRDFIENHLKPYLFSQKYREDNGFFLLERAHGVKGNVQFFIDAFKTNDLILIVNGLRFIKKRKEPNRVSLCFCESGQKFRNCHRETYRMLSIFSDHEIEFFINMIVRYGYASSLINTLL